jgi:hypothetical protein
MCFRLPLSGVLNVVEQHCLRNRAADGSLGYGRLGAVYWREGYPL